MELSTGEHYHKNVVMLQTARNCLEYVLLTKLYKKIYIPYYTCEVILEPLKRHNIEYQFYQVNELMEPLKTVDLISREAFLYTNYFGVKSKTVEQLSKLYGKQLIVDNAQAFFSQPIDGIDTFYSPRKFFGVADGGFLHTDKLSTDTFEKDLSFDRMLHLLKRIDCSAEAAFTDFQKNDGSLENMSIKSMSNLTESILRGINYELVSKKRLENFWFLHSALKDKNQLPIDFTCGDMVPMVYPFWGKDEALRKKLIDNRIYVATYWTNVFKWCTSDDLEYILAKNIIPLPIDQRYSIEDMQKIIQIILTT